MAIPFQCPHCQKAYRVKDHLAGKKVACAECKQIITVPAVPAPVDASTLEALAQAALDTGERVSSNGSATHPTADAGGTIALECPFCFENVEFPAANAGRKAPCPQCRRIVDVPAMKVEKPKDWRTVTERPTLAKVDTEPTPEGAWGNAQGLTNVVSRDALREAEVIVDRKTLAGPNRGKLYATLASIAVICLVLAWFVGGRKMASDRRASLLADAVKAADVKPNDRNALPPGWSSAIYVAAGTYYLREPNPDVKLAARQFAAARNAARAADNPSDRGGLLLDVLIAQSELVGDEGKVAQKLALPHDEAHRELRQTLQVFRELPREYGWLAIETLTRKLRTFGAKEPMIVALAPEALAGDNGRAEALAIVALTLKALGEPMDKVADQAQSVTGGVASPRVTALSMARAAGKVPEAADVESNLGSRMGCAEGHARAGDFEKAARLIQFGSPEEQVAVIALLADALVDTQQQEKLADLVTIVAKHAEKFTLPAWAVERTSRACRRAGRADLVKQLAESCDLRDAKPWLELESLRAHLEASDGVIGAEAGERVGDKSIAQALAWVAIARHNARYSNDDPRKSIDAWSQPSARSVGMAGAALGLQDRGK